MAQISGPDHKLSPFVDEFIKQLEDDFAAPQQSRFQEYMPNCKKGVQEMEDVRNSCPAGYQDQVTCAHLFPYRAFP